MVKPLVSLINVKSPVSLQLSYRDLSLLDRHSASELRWQVWIVILLAEELDIRKFGRSYKNSASNLNSDWRLLPALPKIFHSSGIRQHWLMPHILLGSPQKTFYRTLCLVYWMVELNSSQSTISGLHYAHDVTLATGDLLAIQEKIWLMDD